MSLKRVSFDIEIFKFDWVISFWDLKTNTLVKTIVNNRLQLLTFIDDNRNDTIFIGQNSNNYDLIILEAIVRNLDPWAISNKIIYDGVEPKKAIDGRWYTPIKPIMSIDLLLLCANDLGMNSLKTFEGNIGLDIEQSKIDFKLDRKLTEEELKEVIKYNQYDCYATAQIANVLDSQNFLLSSVELLCDIYKLNKFKWLNKSAAAITCEIMECKKSIIEKEHERFFYKLPNCITITNPDVKYIFDHITFTDRKDVTIIKEEGMSDADFAGILLRTKCKQGSFGMTISENGYNVEFGMGGLHMSKGTQYKTDKTHKIGLFDVSSLYPSLMANPKNSEFRFFTKTSAKGWSYFNSLKDIRLNAKSNKKGKTVLNGMTIDNSAIVNGFKLPLNGMSGAQGSAFMKSFDLYASLGMCFTGQALFYMIHEKAMSIKGLEIIQENTDGIFIYGTDEAFDDFESYINDISDELGLTFEIDWINNGGIFQRDVNFYIIQDKTDGHNKYKGLVKQCNQKLARVPSFDNSTEITISQNIKNNSNGIVYKMVEQKLLNGTDFDTTWMSAITENNWLLFQIILHNVKGTVLVGNQTTIYPKTNRVFATTIGDKIDGMYEISSYVKKIKESKIFRELSPEDKQVKMDTILKNTIEIDGTIFYNGTHKIANSPDTCMIFNKVSEIPNISTLNLDKDYYFNMANDLLDSMK